MTAPVGSDLFEREFRAFVMREEFPCLGARATLGHNAAIVRVFGALGDAANIEPLSAELAGFSKIAESGESPFLSLIAVFPETPPSDEVAFDGLLWTQLQQLADRDSIDSLRHSATSDDPDDFTFAFRFAGVPYFVVGLNPESSRMARRFKWPALVFNPHSVFDRLREQGKYERLKSMIRDREIALQGSLNPNLADFGEASQARQYSGLVHPAEWKCPFHRPTK
jgi:FPC/CPF motif-containing protein YcgG